MGRFFKLVAVFLPLAAFAWAVIELRGMMDKGQGLASIGWLLGALVALAVVEGLLFKCWILPAVARRLGESVYAGGGYLPSEDRLLVAVERIRQEKDKALLPGLEKLVRAESRRARAWQEYSRVLHEVFEDAPAALEVLRRGASRVRDKEDRAMLLCRAAYLATDPLRDATLARSLYEEAAKQYPGTSYGRFAAQRVANLP